MLTIGDIVSVDAEAEFRNDVQIDAYGNTQRNLALLRSYLFSSNVPAHGGAVTSATSPIGLLNHVIEAFLSNRTENRLVAIANYGHGKSHLALAMANYFGKAAQSPELSILFPKIDNTLNNAAKAQRFRDFKASRGEFLVVRLRGDVPRSLREQFMQSLERAIDERPMTTGQRPPFWFTVAERVLQSLSPEDKVRANAFLRARQTDLPQLLRQIQERKDVYDECVLLLTELGGYRPDLGGEVSLKDLVTWAVDTFCGDEKPLGGVFIVFDEFSEYIRKYAQRTATLDLQDLLNGVDDNRGRVVFLAFAQHDPLAVADGVHLPSVQRESLKKELTRLPKKLALYSLMESVIDSYLLQSEEGWQALNSDVRTRGSIYQATDVAYEQFSARYDRELHWPMATFQQTVTRGCFPLHPVTTALLCTLKFGTVEGLDVPRTVLGFVLEHLEARRESPAVVDDKLQWVLPVDLVDYFGAYLRGDLFTSYETALRLVDLESQGAYVSVLKALLLQEVTGVRARGDDQVNFLAQAAGLESEETKQALVGLCDARAIRYDPRSRINMFWSATTSPDILESRIRKKLDDLPLDSAAFEELEGDLNQLAEGSFGSLGVSIPWGESSDWAAVERLLTVEQLSEETVRELVPQYLIAVKGLVDGARGAVVWLLARTDDDVAWYRANLAPLVERALPGEAPVPVVFVPPAMPTPDLIESFQRKRALAKFDHNEIEEVGADMYRSELAKAKLDMLRALASIRGDNVHFADIPRDSANFVVPLAHRGRVNALSRPSVRSVLRECYGMAYRNAPPSFRTDWKANKAALKTATGLIAGLLLQNSPNSLRVGILSNAPARDICNQFLVRDWQLLGADYRIQEPNSSSIWGAWNVLEGIFPAGISETPLRKAMLALLNVPNGYDYNTATLLFCAWFGFHSQDIQVSANGRIVNRDTLANWLARGPKEFINEACVTQSASLARKDPGDLRQEVRAILERMKNGSFGQEHAEQALSKLSEYARDDRNSEEEKQQVADRATVLQQALSDAKEYDRSARALQTKIAAEKNVASLLKIQEEVAALPRPTLVTMTGPTAANLQTAGRARLKEVVEQECQKYEDLRQLTQVDLHKTALKNGKTRVERAGLAELVDRYDRALRTVDEKKKALDVQESEEKVRIEIRGMDPGAKLKTLYDSRLRLEGLAGYSDRTTSLRDKQLGMVTEAISVLERQAESWRDLLEKCVSSPEVERLRDELLQVSSWYADTPYEELLKGAQEHSNGLRAFFARLEAVIKESDSLSTPDQANELSSEISNLLSQYERSLSQAQQAQIDDALRKVEDRKRELSADAVRWLEERCREFEANHNAFELRDRLQSVPLFFPEELSENLFALVREVQTRVDENIVARIEHDFRQLADRTQKVACLSRLQRVLEDA